MIVFRKCQKRSLFLGLMLGILILCSSCSFMKSTESEDRSSSTISVKRVVWNGINCVFPTAYDVDAEAEMICTGYRLDDANAFPYLIRYAIISEDEFKVFASSEKLYERDVTDDTKATYISLADGYFCLAPLFVFGDEVLVIEAACETENEFWGFDATVKSFFAQEKIDAEDTCPLWRPIELASFASKAVAGSDKESFAYEEMGGLKILLTLENNVFDLLYKEFASTESEHMTGVYTYPIASKGEPGGLEEAAEKIAKLLKAEKYDVFIKRDKGKLVYFEIMFLRTQGEGIRKECAIIRNDDMVNKKGGSIVQLTDDWFFAERIVIDLDGKMGDGSVS